MLETGQQLLLAWLGWDGGKGSDCKRTQGASGMMVMLSFLKGKRVIGTYYGKIYLAIYLQVVYVPMWMLHLNESYICCCSAALSCLTLCNPLDCSIPDFRVLHHLLEVAQTHVHWVGDAIQPAHPLSSPSPPAFNLSQNQSLFQWVGSSHQVAKVLELQLQLQSLHWIFRIDFL